MTTLALADIGKITVVRGEVFVKRDAEVIKAYNSMKLLREDIIETGHGRMQMSFKDNTVISLGKDSRFIIKEYLYMPNTNKFAATFKIEKGFIKTITGTIGKMMPELFILETSAAKIRPNGTIWSVRVNSESEHYVVHEGKIDISFHDILRENRKLQAGESLTLNIESVDSIKIVRNFKNSRDMRYENSVESNNAWRKEDQDINKGTTINAKGELVGNSSNGHGFDPSNLRYSK